MRRTNLPMTHGGGTRSRPVRTSREETPVRRMGCAGPAIYDADLHAWPKELAVERFPVDVDPDQIVRWIMAEHKAAPLSLKTSARRVTAVQEIPARSEYHLGDEERADLSEVATIATLEIAPAREHDGWLLTVTVEDEIGPRVSAEGAGVEAEQQIDVGTFYKEYIRPGRGVANVVAEVESPSAKLHVSRLLDSIERNLHPIEPASLARAEGMARHGHGH